MSCLYDAETGSYYDPADELALNFWDEDFQDYRDVVERQIVELYVDDENEIEFDGDYDWFIKSLKISRKWKDIFDKYYNDIESDLYEYYLERWIDSQYESSIRSIGE